MSIVNKLLLNFVVLATIVNLIVAQSYLSNSRFKGQYSQSTTPSPFEVVNNLAAGSIAAPQQASNFGSRNSQPGFIPESPFSIVNGQTGGNANTIESSANNGQNARPQFQVSNPSNNGFANYPNFQGHGFTGNGILYP